MKKTMKIALFTETYLPYINGVVTHVKSLKDGLEQLGHEVLVVTAESNARHHYVQNGVLYCPAMNLKRFYDYGISYPVSQTRFEFLQQFAPDIIHIHTEFGVGYSGAAIAKRLNVPLIYTLHTMYDDYLYYVAPRPFIAVIRRVAHRYARYLAEHATMVTGPSLKVQEYLKACGANVEVTVVPNPVELDMFRPENIDPQRRTQFRQAYGFQPQDTVVCFCGRLGREKSVDVLLKYWAATVRPEHHLKLIIFGGGPSEEELRELAQKLNIADTVSFTGKIPHEELPHYYAGCDLYATTSLSDTNSISMLEAMATGLPVLHIHDPLNAGQVRDGVNGYIFHNEQELLQQMLNWKALPQKQQQEFRLSVRNSVGNSGAIDLARAIEKVYQKALGQNSPVSKKEQRKLRATVRKVRRPRD